MGALADFAQGFFQNRADAAQRQELARDEMSAYERKLKLQQTFQEQLEATKVAKEVPDLERGVIVMYNSKGKEIGTRQMSQAEVQSYRNSMDKESAETRRAGALASLADKELEGYESERDSIRRSREAQTRSMEQSMGISAAEERRRQAEFEALGPGGRRGALGAMSPDRQLRMDTGAGKIEGQAQAILDAAAANLAEDDPRNAQLLTEYEKVLAAPPEQQARLLSQFIARYGSILKQSEY